MMDPPNPESVAQSPSAPGMCVHHPTLKAAFVCGVCGQPICSLCGLARTDGSRICSACASSRGAHSHSGPRLAGSGEMPSAHVRALKCIQHPNLGAAQVCKACGAPMCATCDFLLPGNIHLCPVCVAAPPKGMSRGRKGLIIAAYILAIWNTICLAIMVGGAGKEAAVGLFMLQFVTSAVGTALGISCIDPRLRNPISVWAVAIWNSLFLLLCVIFIVLGQLSR